jgi:hypothetical protein
MILTIGAYRINLDRVFGWSFNEKFSLGREKSYSVTFYTGGRDLEIVMGRDEYVEVMRQLNCYKITKNNKK